MLVRRLAVLLGAVLAVGAPTVAYATIDHCPAGVSDVRGTQPSYATVEAYLEQAAAAHGVPLPILRAVAYQESHWTQFHADGTVVVSGDNVCGLGIMQVTADTRDDAVQLASDWHYNVDTGADILFGKWTESQSYVHAAPNGYAPDDIHAMENWYYALCLYNGCSGNDTYAARVAEIVADPFRRVDATLKQFMPIGGFTKPVEADPSYVFPNAFQADLSPEQFVFYDSSTGNVTSVVPAPTHDDRLGPPSIYYGAGTYGPDGAGVTCTTCGGWRLAEDHGVAGRAHWTYSAASAGTTLTWKPSLPRAGRYRVRAYVADVTTASDAMGTATYHVGGTTVAVDQAALAGEWPSLGDYQLTPGSTVWLNDVADVSGKRLVADAMRFSALTSLSLTTAATTVTYGSATALTMRLTQQSSTAGLGNAPIQLWKRKVGVTGWTYAGTWHTNATGDLVVNQAPSANAEYQARYVPPGADTLPSTSPIRRVYVRTKVTATRSGRTISATIAPNHAGQTVTLQRYYGGVWHGYLARTLSASSTASFTVSTAGTYRVYKPADSDHVVSWSATLTVP